MPFRVLNIHEPNHELRHGVFFLEQISLIISIQIALLNVLASLFASIEQFLPSPLLHMRPSSALAALCASVALFLLESGRTERLRYIGHLLGAITGIIAAVALGLHASSPSLSGGDPQIGQVSLAPFAFLLLGLVIFLLRTSSSPMVSRVCSPSSYWSSSPNSFSGWCKSPALPFMARLKSLRSPVSRSSP
jgi:hypothetical protein